MSMKDEEKKDEACILCGEVQELAGDLWGSIQMYSNRPPPSSVISWLKLTRDRLKTMVVEQEENNYELIRENSN